MQRLFVRGLKTIQLPIVPTVPPPKYTPQHFYDEGIYFLMKGDNIQASERFWSCATFQLKGTMFAVGFDLRSHDAMDRAVYFLESGVTKDVGNVITSGWHEAEKLHQNHYKNLLSHARIQNKIPPVVAFVNALEKTDLKAAKERVEKFVEQAEEGSIVKVDYPMEHGGTVYKVTYRINF